jgi:tRNA (guanosine-2'-O-)-methyltransferase
MKTNIRIKADKAKLKRCKTLIAVLENPKTIENIGSTLRNVDALGVSKLYVVDKYKILGNASWHEMRDKSKLNKISASAIKWTFVHPFTTTSECLTHLKDNGYVSMVTSPHVKGKINHVLEDGEYTQNKLAVWFGNESHGVSDEAVNASVACINIPMCGIIESLNLGTSTGIVLYEVSKQRRQYKTNRQSTAS